MTRSWMLIGVLVLLAGSATAQEHVVVFAATGPGGPSRELLADIDASVRRGLVLQLPPERYVTLMADAAAPGCTGRCAVKRAAEFGAGLGLAVRFDRMVDTFELELTVYTAPDGAVLVQRRARARSEEVIRQVAEQAAVQVALALMGDAPGVGAPVVTDPDAEQQVARSEQTRLAEAVGANSLGITMLLVEQGRPYSEPPIGQQYIQARPLPTPTRPYLLATTEVTQCQWNDLVEENPSAFPGDSRPVERVSWLDAVGFCNALSRHEGLEEAYQLGAGTAKLVAGANGYRLPTDPEWEYACRAGATTMFASGGRRRDLKRVAWFADNARGRTHDVADREPNAWGFYDMHGNVWEWVWDPYASLPDLSRDNVESPGVGPDRTIRGGSWYVDAAACRLTNFCRIDPGFRCCDLGFRVARTP